MMMVVKEEESVGGAAGAVPANVADKGADNVANRRSHDRFDVEWSVDCVADDTFLFASIANISQMGIFVRTTEPLPLGMRMTLSFAPPGHEPFKLPGAVAWINRVRPNGDNPNPGMGIKFVDLALADRERLVEVIRRIAYVREPS
jgi:type IV pilus assembly protein PilZ